MALKFKDRPVTENQLDVAKPLSLATVKGTVYVNSLTTGLLEQAVAGTSAAKTFFLAEETVAAGVKTTVKCTLINRGDLMIADLVNNSASGHNGQRMTLSATGDTLTNSGTDAPAGQFEQLFVTGTAANRRAIVTRI